MQRDTGCSEAGGALPAEWHAGGAALQKFQLQKPFCN